MEGYSELSEGSDRMPRRAFVALSSLLIAQALRGVCDAEESQMDDRQRSADAVRDAMNRIGMLTLDDFRGGVDVAGITIRVPADREPWGSIVAGEKEWFLIGKRRLAKLADRIVFHDLAWDGEAGELITAVEAQASILGRKRKKLSRKTISLDKTVELFVRLRHDDEDIILTDAEGVETGVVLTLKPEQEEEKAEEE